MILLHSSSNAALSLWARLLPANLPPDLAKFVLNGWIPDLAYTFIALIVLIATRDQLSMQKPGPPSPAAAAP